ncbi:MAG: TonB family protein [Acidobacteria bacterium]|nr:TonB family protein [Acidobacteriota bacterium]
MSVQASFTQEPVPKIINTGVVNGKAISLPAPNYPEKAKENNIKGAVTVEVVIGHKGNIESAKAISGHDDLRDAATEAARQAKFQPTLINGIPVKVKGVIVYNFGSKPVKPASQKSVLKSPPVVNGLASALPKPDYPPAAKAVCAEGNVFVEVVINTEGTVLSAKAASGHPLLRASSVKAAEKAKFKFMHTPKLNTTGILVYKFKSETGCSSKSD